MTFSASSGPDYLPNEDSLALVTAYHNINTLTENMDIGMRPAMGIDKLHVLKEGVSPALAIGWSSTTPPRNRLSQAQEAS